MFFIFSAGQYAYIETSKPRKLGDVAALESVTFGAGRRFCLHFFYHMYGGDIGSLKVEVCILLIPMA